MSKWYAYAVGYADGYQEVRFLPDDKMKTPGAMEAFEADLREKAMWFYPLGEIESRPDGRGYSIDIAPLAALVNAWKARGAPKITGTGAGCGSARAPQ